MIVQKAVGVPNRIVLDLTDDEMRELRVEARRSKQSACDFLKFLFVMELASNKVKRGLKPVTAAKMLGNLGQ